MSRGTCRNQLIDHILKLLTYEDGDDRWRCLLSAETVVVARNSRRLAEQVRMAVNCFHNAGKNQKDSLARIKNLEFTVLSEDAIPEEMQKVIQEKHPNPFKITYSDNGFLYIGIGYGEQPAGGFGITVNDLYLTENAIYFDTTLLGPSPDSETPASDTASYPYLVIKNRILYNIFCLTDKSLGAKYKTSLLYRISLFTTFM